MKPTLLILAAGMASRYGSMKQIEVLAQMAKPLLTTQYTMQSKPVLAKLYSSLKKSL